MRILVVSDSHGRWGALYNVIQSQPTAEIIIHLGDGCEDLDRIRGEFPRQAMFSVAGNCDFFSVMNARGSDTLSIGETKIFFTHGHNYKVKSGYSLVEQAARERGAAICLFGHTHVPFTECRSGLYMMNPGSVGCPHDGRPTFGTIDITPAGIVTRIHECDR